MESTWSTKMTKKKVLSEGVNLLPNLKDKRDAEITDREQIVEVATAFYEELYRADGTNSEHPDGWQDLVTSSEDVSPITNTEVSAILSKLKSGRAPGPDGIGNDILKLV